MLRKTTVLDPDSKCFEWVDNNKNNLVPLIDGYLFRHNRIINLQIYWKCVQKQCRVTALTEGKKLHWLRGSHNHEKGPQNPIDKVLNVIEEELDDTKVKSIGQIKKIRTHLDDIFMTPSPIQSIDKERIKKVNYKIPFSGDSKSEEVFEKIENEIVRKLIVISDQNTSMCYGYADINLFKMCAVFKKFELFIDSHFSKKVNGVYTVYVIHGTFSGSYFPLMYLLIDSELKPVYQAVIKMIENQFAEFNFHIRPNCIKITYNVHLYQTLKQHFPSHSLKGSYFNFCKHVWEKMSQIMSMEPSKNRMSFIQAYKKLSLFPLIPPEAIDSALEYIVERILKNTGRSAEVVEYVNFCWTSATPQFARSMWEFKDEDLPAQLRYFSDFHKKIDRYMEKGSQDFSVQKFVRKISKNQKDLQKALEKTLEDGIDSVTKKENQMFKKFWKENTKNLSARLITIEKYFNYMEQFLIKYST